jgi:hypothetical protein
MKPEEVEETLNADDKKDALKIERQIDQYLRNFPSQAKPKKKFEVVLSDRVGEPSRQVKKLITEMYLGSGWAGVEFKDEYVNSDLSNHRYVVILTKKIADSEEETVSPLSRKESTYPVIREAEWMGTGEIGKILWEEINAAVETWVNQEFKRNGFSNLIVIKKLETYCHKIMSGKKKEISISYEDVIALEKISRNTGIHYQAILHYVLEPYPQVEMLIESGGGNMTIEFFDKNSRRV